MNAAITGSHIRLDVPTKCKIVEKILTRKYNSKEELNTFINVQADKHYVNPITIKMWCAQYADIYAIGKQLPAGVMSYVVDPLDKKALKTVVPALQKFRDELATFKAKYHTSQPRKSKEILEELLNL